MTEGSKNRPEDEAISAWIDGNLDRGGATEMENLANLDGNIAKRAARLRYLDGVIRKAVPLDEAVPEDLLARLGLASESDARPGAEVVDFAAARAARQGTAGDRPVARSVPFLAGGWRIAAQLVLVLGIGLAGTVWLRSSGSDQNAKQPAADVSAPYVALGDAPTPGQAVVEPANAIVMFSAGIDANEARAIATGAGARVISGPTSTGAWQLAIAADQRDAVLLRLRHRGDVSLAEPIDGVEP